MEESIRARTRLWLQAERAWGASAVVVSKNRQPESLAQTPPCGTEGSLFGPFGKSLTDLPAYGLQERVALLRQMEEQVRTCRKCRLCEGRRNTVFGEGDPEAAIFFIGEGPGESEDASGRPFVGRAGQKLDDMIAAMGLRRQQVYIGNVVKCRPPGNRTPAPDELEACTPYLIRQLEIIRPKVIITLGLPATKFITGCSLGMSRLRGQWQTWRGIRVMPTFHPAYILRNYTTETRRAVWSDLQKVMEELGLKGPTGRFTGKS